MDDDIIKIDQKCCRCDSGYYLELPKLCGKCFSKEAFENLKKDASFKGTIWREYRELGYFVILEFVPLMLIGHYYGLDTQLLCILFLIWSVVVQGFLVKILTKIF